MSKNKMKNLLNEGTIRRFMKLAEIDTLSDDFVNTLTTEEETIEEMYHAKHDDKKELDDENVEEGYYGKMMKGDDEPVDEMAHPAKHDDEPVGEGAHEDAEDDADEPMMDEPAAEGADLAADLARGMAAVIEDVLGVSVAVEDGEADAEPAEPEMGDMDEPGLPEPEDDMDAPMMEEDEVDEELALEDLTREIAERVTARLQNESRKEKLADTLAERIIQRLKNQ
tara:strand:- start:120 stop:794 length:675 start_codon:yes stop_codon:yes gene_type:complete